MPGITGSNGWNGHGWVTQAWLGVPDATDMARCNGLIECTGRKLARLRVVNLHISVLRFTYREVCSLLSYRLKLVPLYLIVVGCARHPRYTCLASACCFLMLAALNPFPSRGSPPSLVVVDVRSATPPFLLSRTGV